MKRSKTLLGIILVTVMALFVVLPFGGISVEAARLTDDERVVTASGSDDYAYDTEAEESPSHGFFWLPLSLGLGAIIASIYAGSVKAQLHTVEKRTEANQYVLQNSLQLSAQSDNFLYRQTTKTPINQNPSGGTGGFTNSANINTRPPISYGNPNSRPAPGSRINPNSRPGSGNQIHKR